MTTTTATTPLPPTAFSFSSEIPLSLRMKAPEANGANQGKLCIENPEPMATMAIVPHHSRYYIEDRMSVFLVDGQLFKVHRYQLEQESTVFKDMFQSPPSDKGVEGETDDNPIVLPDSLREFEALLDFIYSRMHDDFSSFNITRWTDLLVITSKYQFDKIRARAIAELSKKENDLDPVDEILLSQKCDVPEWILLALVKLVVKTETPSNADASRLPFDLLMNLWRAREEFKVAEATPRSGPLPNAFSFASPVSSPSPSDGASTVAQTTTLGKRAAFILQKWFKDSGYLPKGAVPVAQIQFPA
ncbi:hypothetical protein OF83DRAFT_148339 [Amylostereum chailletii]|nr:hypothetical protein OF83DRAFT_148339 [Amylostereum chailletii]